MKLMLIRHAKAGEPDGRKYPDDRLRPLTEEGRKEHRLVARLLRKMSIDFDHLLTSPLVRARETAEITAQELKHSGAFEETALLGQEFSIDGVITTLSRYSTNVTVGCVGHEPYLGLLAAALLHREGNLSIHFKKSAILGLEFDGQPSRGKGKLLFFYRPKELVSLAG